MKILIIDGGRRGRLTGYGSLSRSIARALVSAGHSIAFRDQVDAWEVDASTRSALEDLSEACIDRCAVALVISPPQPAPKVELPVVLYTQNALADLPQEWQRHLAGYRGVLVPGQFDKTVFDRYHGSVYVVPQIVEEKAFRPIPRYRHEGSTSFTVMFVGSYGFRKGTDLLLDSVARSLADEPCMLRMFLGASPNFSTTDLVARARRLPPSVELDVHTKTFSPEWMNRFLNQSDVVATMSRGEGWCMPLHEALLAGVPVVAPDSTAMGEYLPAAGVVRIPTLQVGLEAYRELPYAAGFVSKYGLGNAAFEVDPNGADWALRHVRDNLGELKQAALDAVGARRAENQPERLGQFLTVALEAIMASISTK